MITTVVNLYKNSYDVYIGRPGHGQDGYFGNPFKGPNRDVIIDQFKTYFYERIKTDPEYKYRVHQLRGKVLGCFCLPERCHGQIIADYLNSLPEVKSVKLAVIGSRSFHNYAFMCDILKWYDISSIISGGARGADKLAEQYAMEHSIPIKVFPANWDKYGKRAGFLRNEQIIDACDEVVAFWDSISSGTAHSLKLAEEKGKPASYYWPPKTEYNSDDDDEFLMKVGLSHGTTHTKS